MNLMNICTNISWFEEVFRVCKCLEVEVVSSAIVITISERFFSVTTRRRLLTAPLNSSSLLVMDSGMS